MKHNWNYQWLLLLYFFNLNLQNWWKGVITVDWGQFCWGEVLASVATSVEVLGKYIVNAGAMDLQIFQPNDEYASWFWLIGVAMVEGATAAKNNWPSKVESVFLINKKFLLWTLREILVLDLWNQLSPVMTFFNNNIVLDSFIHNTVGRIQKFYLILMYVYVISYHYFNIEGNILGSVSKKWAL